MEDLLFNVKIPAENTSGGFARPAQSTNDLILFSLIRVIIILILFLLSAQFASAEKIDTSVITPAHAIYNTNSEKQDINTAAKGGLIVFATQVTTPGKMFDKTSINVIIKNRFSTGKVTETSLFNGLMAYTSIHFLVRSGAGQKKASISLKKDKVPFGEKGPGNYSYAALSLKIKF